MLMGHHKTRVARRSALRSPLAVHDHNACLGVHLRKGVCGTQASDAGTDHQPVGLLSAFERLAQG
ncbi:hypothetical protein D3C76_1871350 [compost metagenome]